MVVLDLVWTTDSGNSSAIGNGEETFDAVHYNNQVFTTTQSENFNSALLLALVCF